MYDCIFSSNQGRDLSDHHPAVPPDLIRDLQDQDGHHDHQDEADGAAGTAGSRNPERPHQTIPSSETVKNCR